MLCANAGGTPLNKRTAAKSSVGIRVGCRLGTANLIFRSVGEITERTRRCRDHNVRRARGNVCCGEFQPLVWLIHKIAESSSATQGNLRAQKTGDRTDQTSRFNVSSPLRFLTLMPD
jgi:hypothetical protein